MVAQETFNLLVAGSSPAAPIELKMSVNIEIETCRDCPHLKTERYYTADSWEFVSTWYCGKTDRPKPESTDLQDIVENSSRIALVERSRDEPDDVPTWCPLR